MLGLLNLLIWHFNQISFDWSISLQCLMYRGRNDSFERTMTFPPTLHYQPLLAWPCSPLIHKDPPSPALSQDTLAHSVLRHGSEIVSFGKSFLATFYPTYPKVGDFPLGYLHLVILSTFMFLPPLLVWNSTGQQQFSFFWPISNARL